MQSFLAKHSLTRRFWTFPYEALPIDSSFEGAHWSCQWQEVADLALVRAAALQKKGISLAIAHSLPKKEFTDYIL